MSTVILFCIVFVFNQFLLIQYPELLEEYFILKTNIEGDSVFSVRNNLNQGTYRASMLSTLSTDCVSGRTMFMRKLAKTELKY